MAFAKGLARKHVLQIAEEDVKVLAKEDAKEDAKEVAKQVVLILATAVVKPVAVNL